MNANEGIGAFVKLTTTTTNLRRDPLAMFATQALLPASEGVKWQGKGSLPAAAITTSETTIFRGFL